jgi:DnaJ-class molecular chaperone
MDKRDYYADLGLPAYATTSQIKAAFHVLAKQHHPDRSGSSDTSTFRRIREAFEKLSDAAFKTEYDRNYRSWRVRFNTGVDTGTEVGTGPTRTAAYEAEAAHEANVEERYTAWKKRNAAYHQKHPTYDQA